MPDISDSQNVSDYAVAVPIDRINIFLYVFLHHRSLQLCTLICVKAHIIGIIVEAQRCHIQFSGGAVGRLAVEPYQRLVLIRHVSGSTFVICRSITL